MSSSFKRISVIGAGSWGTAVANLFADGGSDTVLWGRDQHVTDLINEKHENDKYLKGFQLNPKLKASSDLAETLARADVVVCAIPTQQIRSVFDSHRGALHQKPIVNTSKGIEMGTLKRVSEIFKELSPMSTYAMLSGPTFAQEVVKRLPSAITLACAHKGFGEEIQHQLSNAYFRVYTASDVVGVEIAGALKNIVAIATGVASGLNLGYNAQAAIINRGIAEIIGIAQKFGASPMTFLGLAGMGDLILTCTGPLSRNRTLGLKLGEGKALNTIQKELGGVAEGVYTTKAAYELSVKNKIEMPITRQVYAILYENSTPQQALVELMSRDLKEE